MLINVDNIIYINLGVEYWMQMLRNDAQPLHQSAQQYRTQICPKEPKKAVRGWERMDRLGKNETKEIIKRLLIKSTNVMVI